MTSKRILSILGSLLLFIGSWSLMSASCNRSPSSIPNVNPANTGTRTLNCQYLCSFDRATLMVQNLQANMEVYVKGLSTNFSHYTLYTQGNGSAMTIYAQNGTNITPTPINRIFGNDVFYQTPASGTFRVTFNLCPFNFTGGSCNYPRVPASTLYSPSQLNQLGLNGDWTMYYGYYNYIECPDRWDPDPDDPTQWVRVNIPMWYR